MKSEDILIREQIESLEGVLDQIYSIANSAMLLDERAVEYERLARIILEILPDDYHVELIDIYNQLYGGSFQCDAILWTLDEVRDHIDSLKGKL